MPSFDGVEVRNTANKKVAELRANPAQQLESDGIAARFFGELSLWRPDMKTAVIRASALGGSLILGAKKKLNGAITLLCEEGASTISLRAQGRGRLSISAAEVSMSKLRALRAQFRDLVVVDRDDNERVRFDARRGRLELLNKSGNVTMTLDSQAGDLLLNNADCAEDFDVAPGAEGVTPGAVVALSGLGLRACTEDADPAVAGVVSGAGYRPALILDRQSPQTDPHRVPVALMGKVHCWVDADRGPVQPGSRLTSCETPGHARAVRDDESAAGAILGKALEELPHGRGLVPMLVWPH